MFAEKDSVKKTSVQRVIDELIAQMLTTGADSEEYAAMADQFVKLYPLKEKDLPMRVSPDTLVIVAGNIVGIILIVGYERSHIVTSKALSFLLKLR